MHVGTQQPPRTLIIVRTLHQLVAKRMVSLLERAVVIRAILHLIVFTSLPHSHS